MRLTDELDRLVLGAVGDDFVTLDYIIDKLGSPDNIFAGKVELIYSRLLNLLADKLINAYLLHADPPYVTPVEIGRAALATSWFYITQRGRKCLANNLRRRGSLHSSESDSPDQYPPAVNF
jgi:hypothetical protein